MLEALLFKQAGKHLVVTHLQIAINLLKQIS
jgi:hypothetical protein